ncbi:Gmad2 immunoglobulin-like domain-containing protein [Paenibacillus sp. GCM10027627]|uniref:Gmad2 immunoglobulin-like domain-containing protein n=1 Tax=unclassified Paenibacillus TaxID=185978 RepID=UPI00362B18F2
MKKAAIGTIAATVIAGASLVGYIATSFDDRNVALANQLAKKAVHQKDNGAVAPKQEESFRNVKAEKKSFVFDLKGEASVFEGTYHYAVKQGGKVIASDFGTASAGGPEWGKMEQRITIPADKLAIDLPLTVELYEVDQESGKQVRKISIPVTLDTNGKTYENESFRGLKLLPVSLEYTVKGEAQMHEGTFHYNVLQGGKVVANGYDTASIGAPDWGAIDSVIAIDAAGLSGKGSLTLDLFGMDEESGKPVGKKSISLP